MMMRKPLSVYVYVVLAAISVALLYLVAGRPSGSRLERSWSSWRTFDTKISNPTTSGKKFVNPYEDDFLARQQLQHNLSRTLVVAKTKSESISWITDELSEENRLHYAVYVADDENAPLHVPVNKGRESMVYLSYIIDHYEELPDVSILMHSHGETWHNNDLMDRSSASIVKRLNLEKVVRDGYVNLRCHWNPGCPGHLRTDNLEGDELHYAVQMNKNMVTAFKQMFPQDEMPRIFSQPCCAQFAVSKEAITRHSKQKYVDMRNWLITTDMADHVSGRVFEFIWHYIFTSEGVFCPSVQLCYCDLYSVCFKDAVAWQEYHDLAGSLAAMRYTQGDDGHELAGRLEEEVARRKEEAFANGAELDQRQHILYESWKQLDLAGAL